MTNETRTLLANLRHELRTPLNHIIGYSEMLLEELEADRPSSDFGSRLNGLFKAESAQSATEIRGPTLVSNLRQVQASGKHLLAIVNDTLGVERLEEAGDSLDIPALQRTLRHDLRAPLNHFFEICQDLLSGARLLDDSQLVCDLEKIHHAGENLSSLVNSLADQQQIQRTEEERREGEASPSAPQPLLGGITRIPGNPPSRGWGAEPQEPRPPGLARIMVVDDNPANRDMLQRLLEVQGYSVVLAESGRKAIEMLEKEPADIVLLDMMMPGLDGYEVLKLLKADDKLRHIPVIVVSALDDLDTVVRCIEIGAEDYLPKPFNPVLLHARLQSSLQRKHLLERKTRELDAVVDASTSLISVLDVDTLLQQIMELSKDVMNAEASSLLLLDKEIGKLRFHVARGEAEHTLMSRTVELGHGLAGTVAQTGEPILIEDAYQDSRFDPSYDKATGFHTHSILTVPVKTKDEIIGVVQVLNKVGIGSFDHHDLVLFQSFASMAGIAVENARLFERTRKMAEDLRIALERERNLSIEKEKLGHFVPKELVDQISRQREETLALGGRTVKATILFSDIQGFTRISETLEPQAVVSFLNEYMTDMSRILDEEGGMLDKFIGDGLMGVFQAKNPYDNHALRAVRSGLRMQQRLRELNEGWKVARPELGEVRVRIGINTGEVVAGSMGSETRMDYTVVGDNVNVASRIESNAVAGEVFISEATYQQVQDHVTATRMEPIKVKNREQPVQTYTLYPLHAPRCETG